MEILGEILAKYEVSKLDFGLFLANSANSEVSRLNFEAFRPILGVLDLDLGHLRAYFGGSGPGFGPFRAYFEGLGHLGPTSGVLDLDLPYLGLDLANFGPFLPYFGGSGPGFGLFLSYFGDPGLDLGHFKPI